ncbi:hypothetical protein NJC40_03400 [Pseudomonas sp. 21LCFQ02]|uniref:hypothetical protein n=1 Tax=Pseudomonas sp. 21LCFQ02 TaxID=2957505 RepID=UPI00209AC156|nr:hypothetical protein [Pseudomonas sp. 21LCFQ02]MCO8166823.1 hypothetical protein [Pseudomonas sp. 21LCFQ02]
MKKLIDLLHEGEPSKSIASTTRVQMGVATAAVLGATLGATKSQKFSNSAATLVTSDDFMNELESEIGLPNTDESEDEFVARAKASMLTMLKSKLD